jgi:hypothetical protein
MNLLTKLIIITSLCMSLNAEVKYEAKFGLLSKGNLLASFLDAKLALKVWLEDIATRYNSKIEIEFYDTSEALYGSLEKAELDMVVLDLQFFFKNKNKIFKNNDNFWALNMEDLEYSQYYLIARKSLKAKGFKDIKGKTVSITNGKDGVFIWLDKNSLKENKKSANKVLKNIYLKKKESTTILNVFFNKSDFAIVRKRTWDIATELNPSISKKIEIVKKSEKIHLPFIGFFRKGSNENLVNDFFKVGKDLKNLENNEHIIELLKFNSLFKINEGSLKELGKYYDEYFALKKKYK